MTALRPWRVVDSVVTYEDRWLKVRSDRCMTPEGVEVYPYHVLEYASWINIVPLLDDAGAVLMVREYRHGIGQIMLGLPGGNVEPEETTLEVAARRELIEETGYGDGVFTPILTAPPNSATQTNRVTSFVATGVKRLRPPEPDATEMIETVVADLPELMAGIRDGSVVLQVMHVAGLWAATGHILAGRCPGVDRLRQRLRAVLFGDL
ncbi:MAG TPA: NUDIX hydrolase [Stellaceae bacterium]|nr:NUDIX hydrolase [Stellaceae bacterium]